MEIWLPSSRQFGEREGSRCVAPPQETCQAGRQEAEEGRLEEALWMNRYPASGFSEAQLVLSAAKSLSFVKPQQITLQGRQLARPPDGWYRTDMAPNGGQVPPRGDHRGSGPPHASGGKRRLREATCGLAIRRNKMYNTHIHIYVPSSELRRAI